jgi:hypothetical protein
MHKPTPGKPAAGTGPDAGGIAPRTVTVADPPAALTVSVADPVIIDLGKVSRKKARRLKRGEGSLLAEVQAAVAETVGQLGPAAAGKEILPVVIVYRQKQKKAAGLFGLA